MVGTVQDVTERRELEREHRIAEILQQALLPERLPQLVGIGLAARYVPAEEGSAAGGDWYDVIELSDGGVALVIGDVAGHGTEAASVMGQVRMAVRAFSLEGHAPRVVVGRVHDLLRSLYEGEQMVTMLYLVVDPTTWEATMVNAGHPPPLLLDPRGGATYLETPTGLPVGLNWNLPYEESTALLRPGATLVLYTDGLIDRRDVEVGEGLDRLLEAATDTVGMDIDRLCGMLLEALVPADASDDVAILAARLDPVQERLSLHIPADPARLRSVRRNIGRWLSGHGVPKPDAEDIILASSEACANSIEHAYGPGEGSVDIEAEVDGGEVTIVVRDAGRWRTSRNGDRGRGLPLMEACMDSCTLTRGDAGTEVRMQRRVATVALGMSDLASFAVVKADEIVVGFLSGEIDLSNAKELESQIEDAVPNTALGMVLDLSELRYLDSSGIRLLLSLAGRLRWRGQELVLAAPPESRCRHVLSLAGIESTVLLEATVDAARARLQDPSA